MRKLKQGGLQESRSVAAEAVNFHPNLDIGPRTSCNGYLVIPYVAKGPRSIVALTMRIPCARLGCVKLALIYPTGISFVNISENKEACKLY